MTRAMSRLYLTWAQSRLVFGRRRLSLASRFLNEIPRAALTITAGAAPFRLPPPPAGRPSAAPATARRTGSSGPVDGLRPGIRVRHPFFGEGTVIRSEGAGDDLKLTVTFAGVGAKRLVARYAGLEIV
jgi:DNA helicase-2/ATP-dependent DNA helicase PcrA